MKKKTLKQTYLVTPKSNSISGSISFPSSSRALEISNAARTHAIKMNREESAKCCPGHILRVMQKEISANLNKSISMRLVQPWLPEREIRIPSSETKYEIPRIEDLRTAISLEAFRDELIGVWIFSLVAGNGPM